jgi:hypothetical protein
MGSIGGWFWAKGGWLPVAAFAAALLLVALCAALYLGRLEKWQQPRRSVDGITIVRTPERSVTVARDTIPSGVVGPDRLPSIVREARS